MSDFGKLRNIWLDQVVADRTVSPLAFKVAYIVANRYLNRQSGEAWPTQETLARAVEVTPRAIRKALGLLIDGGHISVTRARGRAAVNRYRLAINERNDSSSNEAFEGNDSSSQDDLKRNNSSAQKPENIALTGTPVPLAEEPQFLQNLHEENLRSKEGIVPSQGKGVREVNSHSPSFAGERADDTAQQPKTPARGTRKTAQTSDTDTPKALEEEFEGWWKQYPRKVDRGHAKAAYLRVRRSGKVSAADLMAGVLRYAAAVAHKEARYIKHGQTWLNGQCWLDEPEAAARHGEWEGEQFGQSPKVSPLGAQIIGLGKALERRRQAGMTGTASAVAGIMSAIGGQHDD